MLGLYITANYLHKRYRQEGKVPTVVIFLREINPYLARKSKVQRKPTIKKTDEIVFELSTPRLPALRAEPIGHWWEPIRIIRKIGFVMRH